MLEYVHSLGALSPSPLKCLTFPPCMQIAKAVEVEVARRLQEERERQRREDEERAAVAAALASTSASTSSSSVSSSASASASHYPAADAEEDDSRLESLPSGLLTPLLKSKGHTSEDELKRRLDELEARLCAFSLTLARRPVTR